MNKTKISILGVAASLLVLSFISVNVVFGADTSAPTNEGTLVATVNILNASIVSQESNVFNISFEISNGQGLQAGLKYGVVLMSEDSKIVLDEKVYDESMTLYENSSIKRDIVYTAPSQISGTYNLYLSSKNESSFPFGISFLGKVKLTASTKGVQVLNNSCYLQVEGEKGNPRYPLTQSLDINAGEYIRLTCGALNSAGAPVSVVPFFETRYFSAYGKIATQTGGDTAPIAFKPNEKKDISLVLPKGDAPQFYILKVSFKDGNTSSNTISVNYIINGVNGMIDNISLDKDSYKSGEKGEAMLLWSTSSGNFSRSTTRESVLPAVSINVKLTNDKGRVCADPINQVLIRDLRNPEAIIPFEIKANCLNPQVSATLTDDKGNVLDQKDFTFESAPESKQNGLSKIPSLLIVAILLAMAGLGIYMKKKKEENDYNTTVQ